MPHLKTKIRQAIFCSLIVFTAFQALVLIGAALGNKDNQQDLSSLTEKASKPTEATEIQQNEVTHQEGDGQNSVNINYFPDKIIKNPALMRRALGTGLGSLDAIQKNNDLEKMISASENGRLNIDFQPENGSAGLLDYILIRTRLSYFAYLNSYRLPSNTTEVAFARVGDCNSFALRLLLLAEVFGIKSRAFTILEKKIPGHVLVELWHQEEKWSAIVDPVESFVAIRPNSQSSLLRDILEGKEVNLNAYALNLPQINTIIFPQALEAQSRQGEVLVEKHIASYDLEDFAQTLQNRFQASVQLWQRNKNQGPYTLKTYYLSDKHLLNINHALPNEDLKRYIHPLK